MAFHSYRISQPRTTAGSLRNEIQAAMENDKRRPRLETIGENHFVISVGTGRRAKFYRVPFTLNQDTGHLNIDFTKEVKINEGQGNELLQQAATAAIQHLSKGGNNMNHELLGPPGVYDDTEQKQNLEQLQEQAEQKDILLPAELNQAKKKKVQQQDDEKDILLPIID